MPKFDHLWDEQEAARYLGVSVHAIRKWKKLGLIGVIKLGSLNRYDPNEIKEFAQRNRVHPKCIACSNLVPQEQLHLPDQTDLSEPPYAADAQRGCA